jgi:hypothetical protein
MTACDVPLKIETKRGGVPVREMEPDVFDKPVQF